MLRCVPDGDHLVPLLYVLQETVATHLPVFMQSLCCLMKTEKQEMHPQ